jgi:predicted nucleic acid-binding protein
MSGKRYFLDTNTIIQLLKDNKELIEILSGAVMKTEAGERGV